MEEGSKGEVVGVPAQTGRLEVVVPEETLVAGQQNSISFILRNPYTVPIIVTEVVGPSSQSITAIEKREQSEKNNAAGKFIDGLLGIPLAIAGMSIAGVEVEVSNKRDRVVNVDAKANAKVKFDEDIGQYTRLNIVAEEGAIVEIGKKSTPDADDPEIVVIPPGSERIFTIFIKTTHWLLFTPRRFPVNIQLGFEVDGETRSQVVAANFSINPPLTSILFGSILGGALGSAARTLQTPSELNTVALVQGIAAIVMSIIASITLSRKTGAQSFITVEDFFGAFAIGALIGYGGSEYFRRAVLPGGAGQVAPPS